MAGGQVFQPPAHRIENGVLQIFGEQGAEIAAGDTLWQWAQSLKALVVVYLVRYRTARTGITRLMGIVQPLERGQDIFFRLNKVGVVAPQLDTDGMCMVAPEKLDRAWDALMPPVKPSQEKRKDLADL